MSSDSWDLNFLSTRRQIWTHMCAVLLYSIMVDHALYLITVHELNNRFDGPAWLVVPRKCAVNASLKMESSSLAVSRIVRGCQNPITTVKYSNILSTYDVCSKYAELYGSAIPYQIVSTCGYFTKRDPCCSKSCFTLSAGKCRTPPFPLTISTSNYSQTHKAVRQGRSVWYWTVGYANTWGDRNMFSICWTYGEKTSWFIFTLTEDEAKFTPATPTSYTLIQDQFFMSSTKHLALNLKSASTIWKMSCSRE